MHKPLVNQKFGVSLSIKQCRSFNISDIDVIRTTIKDLNIKRFRLMSYWDEVEQVKGKYNFEYLDKQIQEVSKSNGEITLCLGLRQPRWPESHWPTWAKKSNPEVWKKPLFDFIETTVKRYINNKHIVSYQLENEALLKNFGDHGEFDRTRLNDEYKLVKELNSKMPIVMTTSTSWGIPIRKPIPDIIGFSYYRVTFDKGAYRKSIYQPSVFRIKSRLSKLIHNRPSFIHELQAEPWGPKNIWEMSEFEQAKSMNPEILRTNVQKAIKTGLFPIDFWGAEWWYWQKQNGNEEIWEIIKELTS